VYNFPLWDSSFILSESTFLGTIVNIFTGYISKPSFWHIIAYFITFSSLLNASKVLKN
jgi:high-affinity Fe2+/Pb2+ permease